MKKALISTVSLSLVFAMALSFASCNGDDDATAENTSATAQATQMNAPQATEKQTENTADTQTNTPNESEPAEDPSTSTAKPAETTAPVEDSATKPVETTVPVETTAPVETSAPTTEASTSSPAESSTPDNDWGKNDFEKMLPVPLPFTDKTEWIGEQKDDRHYLLVTAQKLYHYLDEAPPYFKIIEEYAKSFESYGYTVIGKVTDYNADFTAIDEAGNRFKISSNSGLVSILIVRV